MIRPTFQDAFLIIVKVKTRNLILAKTKRTRNDDVLGGHHPGLPHIF
jgi:hypothetical protein